jgi:hypothetical protein
MRDLRPLRRYHGKRILSRLMSACLSEEHDSIGDSCLYRYIRNPVETRKKEVGE